ncbi:MAG: hypothetical protein H7A25_09645 [Leptospiraceae bacterium]|nr:hypothetical protein [Leptospiraceae bacterium]
MIIKIRENKLLLTFLFTSIILALYPVLNITGWPNNHEDLFWRNRALLFHSYFREGIFFPVWDKYDIWGMGSPSALFYHKLFYYVMGILLFILPTIKSAVVLSLSFFFIIGWTGIYKILKLLNIENYLRIAFSSLLILLNYTYTDWVIRGAMAELSAMMLIPWILWWQLNLYKTKTFSFFIVIIFIALYFSHSIIAYYAGVQLVIAEIIFFAVNRKDIIVVKNCLIRGAIASVIILLILGLNFYLMTAFMINGSYDLKINLSNIKIAISAIYSYHPLIEYFYDKNLLFSEWEKYTVQLDLPITIIMCLTYFFLRKNKEKINFNSQADNLFFIFIVISNFFCAFLQTKLSKFWYIYIPGADYIQFPWRLLAFISIYNLILTAWLINTLQKINKQLMFFAVSVLFLSVLSLYPGFKKIQYEIFPKEKLENRNHLDYPFGAGEYAPYVDKAFEKLAFKTLDTHFKKIYDKSFMNSVCSIKELPISNPVVKQIEATCSQKTDLSIPVNYSGHEKLLINGQDSQDYIRTGTSDSRIKINNFPKGTNLISIKFPTFIDILFRDIR